MFVRERSEAFTGLEAAIVLIAFIVVASVFAFAVIGAGFFTTQKTESIAYSTLQQTGAALEVLGNVHGLGDGDEIGSIRFNVGVAPGGNYIDFDKLLLTWTTSDDIRIYEANDPLYDSVIEEGKWGIINIKPSDEIGDVVLEEGEVYTLFINLTSGEELGPSEEFTIELTSSESMTLILRRHAPSQIDNVNILY